MDHTICNAYLVSSRTDALDDVDDILEADVFATTGAVPDLAPVPYTDLAFLADSPARRELLLPRASAVFLLAMFDFALPLLFECCCFGDILTSDFLADFSMMMVAVEEDDEILRSLASDLHSMSSV